MADLPPLVQASILGDMGRRVVGINESTRQKLIRAIADGIADGLGAAQLGDLIESSAAFGEYRAELIARTETNRVLNVSQLSSFKHYGVNQVQAIDGDMDAECAARNGQVYSVEEANNIEDHPNGTLDWSPVVFTQEPNPIPPPKPTATSKVETFDDLTQALRSRHGVSEFEINELQWTADDFAAIEEAFDSLTKRGIKTDGLVRRVHLSDRSYREMGHGMSDTALASFDQTTRTMTVYPEAIRYRSMNFGLNKTLGDAPGLRHTIQHELGHAIEVVYPDLARGWEVIFKQVRDLDPAPLRAQIRMTRDAIASAEQFAKEAPGGGWEAQVASQKAHLARLEASLKEIEALRDKGITTETYVSDYGSTNFKEDLAESFYAYMRDPEWLRLNRPKRYDALRIALGDR